jgi:hypothetical protein
MVVVIRDVLSSPRRRRRVGWTVGVVVVLAVLVPLGIRFANTGQTLETPIETGAGGQTTPSVAQLKVTPVVRRRVGDTVHRFVHTAVVREHLDAAWSLASPAMRAGVTHAAWLRGDLPVQPFPARALRRADWRLRYVSGRTLGIDVMVLPKVDSPQPVTVYSVELTAPGAGAPRHFLVDYWVPQATLGGGAPPPPPAKGGQGRPEAAPESPFTKGKLGAEWFLVPGVFVFVLAGVLIALAVRGVLQRRRAERLWREHSGR